jgi:type I restriction enzyme S subunit
MGEWERRRINDCLRYERPDKYIWQDEIKAHGEVPVLTGNKAFVLGYTNNTKGVCTSLPTIIFDDFTTDSKFADFPFKVRSSAIKLLYPQNGYDIYFMYSLMKVLRFAVAEHKRHYISEYQNLEISIPNLPEQRRIAAVLTSADEAIAASRALVEKYAVVKQGLMHDLFSPIVRDTALGDTGVWHGGITPSMSNPRYWGEGHYWLSSGEIKTTTLDHSTKQITDTALANTTLQLLPKGTIVLVVRSGILRNYFPITELQIPMAINQDLKGIVLYDGIVSKYILYVMEFYGDEVLRTCMKAGTTVQSIDLKWLKAFKIPLLDKKRQELIAEIFAAADERLTAERKRLQKLEDIKRGLMDDLLTNRVSTDKLQGGV